VCSHNPLLQSPDVLNTTPQIGFAPHLLTTPPCTQFYPSTCEVEVWVSHDDSCLTSIKQGRYLRHFRVAQVDKGRL